MPDISHRNICQYHFEGGGLLKIIVAGDVSTEEALDMAEILIGLKREEIQRSVVKAEKRDEVGDA